MAAPNSVPTFGVRFESHDDFLVEYADHLQRGLVHLPLPTPLKPGVAVRLRIRLPNDASLYVTGHATSEQAPSGEGTLIRLDALSGKQQATLDQCVKALVGASSSAASEDAQERISVLLVDDLVTHRIELGDALRGRGLRVRVAENGLLALSQALKRPPDIVLTDVEMPQMDGWSLLRAIRQRKRLASTPVVFFTRLSDELSRLRGYRMGVDDYLPKTMPADEIVARLQGIVARRRQAPGSHAADHHGLRGDLEHVRLGSLMAFLESERRTGALALRHGNDQARIFLSDGALVRVENCGQFDHPHDRIFELLNWSFGSFEFVPEERPEDGANESTPLSYLLMEHARRTDEARAGG